jgi:hypothetical protein
MSVGPVELGLEGGQLGVVRLHLARLAQCQAERQLCPRVQEDVARAFAFGGLASE